MLRECCQAIKELTTSKYSLKWPHLGTISNGNCSIPKISPSPRIGKECSLSDILEDSVPEKYFPIGVSNAISDEGRIQGTLASQHCSSAITKDYAKGVHSGGETYIQTVGKVNSSQDGFVLSPDGISKTLTRGHFNTPKILQLGHGI